MRIGVVDVDTSHPENWIPIERELGHELVGVWDGGAVHPPEWCALAAPTSWLEGDREVTLTEVRAGQASYDGAAFAEGYRKAKYPS